MNECQESIVPLCEENTECVNIEGSYTCVCLDGYSGDSCAGIPSS